MNNKDNSIINVTDAGTIIGKISQNDLNTKSKRIYKSGLKNAVVYAIPLLTPIKYFIPSKGFPHATTFDDGKFIITGVSVRKYDLLIDGNGDNIADDRIFDVSVSKNNEIDVGEQIIMNFASSHNDAYKWTLDKKQYNLGDPMTLTLRGQNNFTSEVQVGYKIFRSKGEQHEVVENSFDINKFINIPGGKIPLGNTLSTTVDPSWIATNNSELVCYIVQSIYENGEYAGGNQIFQLFGFNVKLISPNGGEILVGTENITWLTSYNSSPSLKINLQYSSDNGTTWIDIISNVPNNGFYAWDTTQVIDGKEYLVRINTIDAVLNSSDTSEAVLSVDNFEEAPIVTLTSPNGGERWKGIQEITWTASDSDPGDSIENIDFQYSDDDGNNWVDIATVTENTGSYYWDLSLLNPGKEYKVRVKVQSGDLTNQDDSDNIFSVNAIGAIWEQKISSAEFSKRLYHSSISYDDRMWVIAGEYAGSCKNDVWYSSDGISWTEATPDADFPPRSGHSSIVFNNRMWVIAGCNSGNRMNDVWSSVNGITWTEANPAAEFSKRWKVNIVIFDNRMWIIGGNIGISSFENDVWYSFDGITWTEATGNAGFSKRFAPTSVVYDNRMWIIGGFDTNYLNDVWYSYDGATWSEAIGSTIFGARYAHSSIVFDNRMWVIGGEGESDYLSDVWYSYDGLNWTESTSTAGFGKRCFQTLIEKDDSMWIIGGEHLNLGLQNDVWCSP